MSHARWTPSPVVERETERWLQSIKRQNRAVYGTVGSVLVGAVGLALLGLEMGGAPGFVAFLILTFGGGFAVLRSIDRRRADSQVRANAFLAPLREEFGPGAGTLVRLRLLQGDAPTGEDAGMLWIEDGRLLFAGQRTSFALGSSQVVGPCRIQANLKGLRYPVRLTLAKRTTAGHVALSLEPLDVDPAHLAREIDRWSRTFGPVGQLPPMEAGPGAASFVRLLAGAVYATAFWGIAWASVILSHGALVVLLAFAAVLAPTLNASSPLVRWRAVRDRRRVRSPL